ncbi:SDR family oxidoreductase [Halorussus lipolyticus]|uniref:SDR family oxidoreductase n=1 Tax=Halorussus lipolyticus TaxID=3034024 RepID=UPI0023E86826|nr:SDR family oxidoreductase [Halorussus sp. DT80]
MEETASPADSIDRVLVAGATGRTGREILRTLESTDFEVVGLARSLDDRGELLARGADEVVVGDLLEPRDAARAVRGCDAVLCAVGSGPTLAPLFGEPLVDGEGVRNLVTAAVAADCEAVVFESSIGVGDSESGMPAGFRMVLGPILRAKNDSEAALRSSGLRYTILRPGGLTDAPATGNVVVGEGGATVSGTIPRADVARLMVAALFTPEASNRTFEVVSRSGLHGTPRGLVELDWQYPDDRGPVKIEVEESEDDEDAE